MRSALPWFDVIEQLGDEARLGPTRMVAVKAPVSIVEADELSFAVGSRLFKNDGNALEVPGAIAPQPTTMRRAMPSGLSMGKSMTRS